MTENTNPRPDIADEFRELGENLKNMLQGAWQSEEAQRLRDDIKTGLEELSKSASEAVTDFNTGETGQRLKEEAHEFKTRVESGEVEIKARAEISKVLRTLNDELQKVIDAMEKHD
ncbi:MAG: hypothetical protein HN413_15590 [Chloroflexi bacterium]|jgi:hypothetical protein|nr:hypothetical protein [Chloroflexota bacterium]